MMEAGRELDALVEWHVFGSAEDRAVPPFSTDIAAAWMVVERMPAAKIQKVPHGDPLGSPRWQATLSNGTNIAGSGGDTAPLAICLAALAACGVDVQAMKEFYPCKPDIFDATYEPVE